jgi:hypothetical protein
MKERRADRHRLAHALRQAGDLAGGVEARAARFDLAEPVERPRHGLTKIAGARGWFAHHDLHRDDGAHQADGLDEGLAAGRSTAADHLALASASMTA